jgi:putative protease
MKIKPELLSPAGSFDSLIAAINGGCDAVYVGGKQFSARAYASNFDTEELIKAIDYCHLRGVKIYLTVNTLFKEQELNSLIEYINIVYNAGIDALIIQDLGVAKLIKQTFKNLEIHASTQMTIHNLHGVEYLKNFGFSRVVLSRESNLDEIKYIINNTDTEIECFIHGALCYSYSGQCLMSSILGGRSGNRGRCAGTCRLPYTLIDENQKINTTSGKYLLSPKDIATIDILPELIDSGIHSFKIEGRMKSPEYVYSVTSIYRKYIDKYLNNPEDYKVEKEDKDLLLQIYNRGGFSKGYYTDKNNQLMSMIKPNNQGVYIGKVTKVNKNNKTINIKLDKKVNKGDKLEIWTGNEPFPCISIKEASDTQIITLKEYNNNIVPGNKVYRIKNKEILDNISASIKTNKLKKDVKCKIKLEINKPITIDLYFSNYHITEVGSIVEKARNQSLATHRIIKQFKKTGEYPFEMDIIEANIEEDVFIPISEINKLRRNALEKLSNAIIDFHKKEPLEITPNSLTIDKHVDNIENNIFVLIRNIQQLNAVIQFNVEGVYIESELIAIEEIKEMVDICNNKNIKSYVALPRIFNKKIQDKFMNKYKKIQELNVNGYLVRTYGEMNLVENTNKEIVIDYNLNVINNQTINTWKQKGASRITLSPELHNKDIYKLNNISSEILIYGYLPLMVSKQCVVTNATKNSNLCYNNKKYYLKDRYGKNFYIDRRCINCHNVIYNSSPLILFDQSKRISELGINNLRLEFTTEKNKDIVNIMKTINNIIFDNIDMSTDNILRILDIDEFNRGHFLRGIE